jgi:hypothetical protein
MDFAAAMSGKPYVDEAPPDIPPATPCSPISSLPLLPSPGAQNQKAVTINLSPLRKLSLTLSLSLSLSLITVESCAAKQTALLQTSLADKLT